MQGRTIPDALWLERDKRRREFIDARDNVYNGLDEESIIRMIVKKQRAEIAEICDTSLRWQPDEAVGHRKIAHSYWLIYDAQKSVTNLRKARKHLRYAIRAEPGNWLQH